MLANIDSIYFLTFLVPIVLNSALLFYYRNRKELNLAVMGYSFLAYFIAIGIKTIFQYFTEGYVTSIFGFVSIETAIYLGAQTSVFEVGLAYLFAGYAFNKRHISARNAVSYGISLSFWENAIFFGVLSGISMMVDYLVIAFGPPSISHLVYDSITKSQPSLMFGLLPALVTASLSILERTSSLLAHTAWGILTVLAIAHRKRTYLYIALPMGLIDSLVPYSSSIGIYFFETVVFLLSLLFLSIALYFLSKNKGTSDQKVLLNS